MTEKILVFKGEIVVYYTHAKDILCLSQDDCFRITDVDPKDVFGQNVNVIISSADDMKIIGKELWSSGSLWIIKG